MALVSWPRVIGAEIDISQDNSGVIQLSGPFSDNDVQFISRGVLPWEGVITWPTGVWRQDINRDMKADELSSFLDSLEGGLNHFHIPLRVILLGRPFRFPALTEIDEATSVKCTAVIPASGQSGATGTASTLTLSQTAGASQGLRKGDWISLRPASDDPDADVRHYGAYRCFTHQTGDQVTVTPSPPTFDSTGETEYQVKTREPTLSARAIGKIPSLRMIGAWYQPITLQWRQYNG